MSKVGRNDPCPCGSGKKYKKCCLLKDQEADLTSSKVIPIVPDFDDDAEWDDEVEWDNEAEWDDDAEREPLMPSSTALTEEDEEPDPLAEDMNAFLAVFMEAEPDEKWQLVEDTLKERPELFDEEMAFEVFDELYGKTAVPENRSRFEALVNLLRQQAPEAYEHEAHYMLGWRIENELANGNYDAIPPLFNELSLLADARIDEFNRVEQKVAYHGLLETLLVGHRLAWPRVKNSSNIIPWGIDEFASRAADYETYALLMENPSLAANDPLLLGKLETYFTPDADRFSRYMACLTGPPPPQWTIDDFAFAPPRRRSDWYDDEEEEDEEDPAVENLFWLTVAFTHYLHHEEQAPYPKARLARRHFNRYFLERHAGELEPVDSPLFAPRRQKQRQKGKKAKQHRYPLCPDRQTLDRYMAQLIGFMSSQYHVAGALLELVPAWLRFLEKYHLIDAAQREKTLQELKGLDTAWLTFVEKAVADPLLQANAEKWPENAGLA